MNIIRYSPSRLAVPSFNPGSLLTELDRLFEAGFPSFDQPRCPATFPIDIYRNNESVIVRAELPGFQKEDLQVGVDDDVLTISIAFDSKEQSKEASAAKSSVARTVTLPEGLDHSRIAAAYENGVLSVTLPKRPETKPTKVTVEVK